ncbi:MAG: hypothetical protein KDD61_01980 [Bdellovibrionales bacterium]|nr:hypothetical protein [Bdellovibrionales bacterium]
MGFLLSEEPRGVGFGISYRGVESLRSLFTVGVLLGGPGRLGMVPKMGGSEGGTRGISLGVPLGGGVPPIGPEGERGGVSGLIGGGVGWFPGDGIGWPPGFGAGDEIGRELICLSIRDPTSPCDAGQEEAFDRPVNTKPNKNKKTD